MPVQFTMPPDTRASGTADPPNDVNALIRAANALGAGFSVLNAAFASGADPAGSANSAAAFNAAIAAIPATGGYLYVPPGTYKIGSALSALTTGDWIICAPGVQFNFTGTGDCFRWVDTSTYTTRTTQGGGILGRPIIDGSGDGAGSCALHAGDILGFRFDIAVQGFSKAGDIAIHLDNQNFWTEQAIGVAYITGCTSDVVFDVGGAVTSAGSFDRGNFTFYVQHTTFTGDSITWNNGAYQVGGEFRLYGNYASSGSAFSHSVLNVTGSIGGSHPPSFSGLAQCELDINVESDGALANTFRTVSYGSTSNTIVNCSGNISFGPGNQFTTSNITTLSSQFTFVGPVIGDSTLNQSSLSGRLSVPSQAFFFSSAYFGNLGSAPGTPSGGGLFYSDTNGIHWLGSGGTDTVLARQTGTLLAASVSYVPADPTGVTSSTFAMMGLGSTCTFTPAATGKTRITVSGSVKNSTPTSMFLKGAFGTGTAPVNGAASTGTKFGVGADNQMQVQGPSGTSGIPFSVTQILSLTPGTAYWFDVALASNTTGTTSVLNVVASLDELAA